MEGGPTSTGTPRLSVVVPVYRVEAYLVECLDSILCHPDDGLEVIAVDDASPDGCGAMLDDYARRDPRVRVVHLHANGGLGGARNVGLDHASGAYVWFVDSDDWLPPGAVAAVRKRLAKTHPDVLIIDYVEVRDNGRIVPHRSAHVLRGTPVPLRLEQRPQLLRLAHSACTKVVRRDFLAESRLRFLPGWYEDCSFTHPMLMAAGSIDVLGAACYCYRLRANGGITTTVSARHFEVFDQYERLFAMVDQAAGAYDTYRPELFRLMINHLLVIAGSRWRMPAELRQAFFRRLGQEYRRRLPPHGYPVPGGVTGLKHWLVRHDSYLAYATLRRAHRFTSWAWRLLDRAAPTASHVLTPTRERRRPEQAIRDLV